MKEILNEILNAEKAGEEKIRKAREKAVALKHKADTKAEEIVRQAGEEGQHNAKNIISAAEKHAEEELTRELRNVAGGVITGKHESAGIEAAAEKITQILLNPGKEPEELE
ncbi:MAG: hypothetical protein ACLFST_15380 [Spirochaetia bacterium]